MLIIGDIDPWICWSLNILIIGYVDHWRCWSLKIEKNVSYVTNQERTLQDNTWHVILLRRFANLNHLQINPLYITSINFYLKIWLLSSSTRTLLNRRLMRPPRMRRLKLNVTVSRFLIERNNNNKKNTTFISFVSQSHRKHCWIFFYKQKTK